MQTGISLAEPDPSISKTDCKRKIAQNKASFRLKVSRKRHQQQMTILNSYRNSKYQRRWKWKTKIEN